MATSTAEILLKVNSDLAALARARSEFSRLREEVSGFGNIFKGVFAGNIASTAISSMAAAARDGVGTVVHFFSESIKEGVRFNATLETSKLGIAAVLKQFDPVRYKNFADATRDAASAIELLKQKALESPATFEALLQAFQATTGQMTAAGIAMDKQVGLVTNMSQALSGLGIRSEQILQETRALVTGNINEDAMAARILGITSADIARAKEKGQLYEFLSSKISAFAEAGRLGAQSITTLESNLQDARTQQAANSTVNLAEAYRQLLTAVTAGVGTESYASVMRAFSDAAATALSYVTQLLQAFQQSAGLNEAISKFSNYFKALFMAGKSGNLGEFMKLSLEIAFKEATNILVRGLKAAGLMFIDLLVTPATWEYMFRNFQLKMALVGQLFVTVVLSGIQRVIAYLQTLQKPWTSYGDNMTKLQPKVNELAEPFQKLVEISADAYDKAAKEFGNAAFDSFAQRFKEGEGIFDTARQREALGKMVAEGAAAYQAANPPNAPVSLPAVSASPVVATDKQRRKELEDMLRKYREELENIRNAVARIDGDFTLTAAEKWQKKKEYLEAEKQKLDEIISALKEKLALEQSINPDGPNVGAIESRIEGFTKDREAVGTKSANMGPDPMSFSENLRAEMTSLMDEWGTMAQQMAKTLSTAINSGISSISSNLTAVIMRTKSWQQALADIGTTILTTVIQSIIQMGVRWVATQIMMAVMGKQIQAAAVAASGPIALAQSSIWATPATLATIASFGGAAVAAPGFIAAANASTLAASLAMFADGGYTGPGGKWEPKGIVHAGEVVFSQADVARWGGPASVESIRTSSPTDFASVSPETPSAAGKQVSLTLVDSRSEARRIKSGSEAETQILELVRRNRYHL